MKDVAFNDQKLLNLARMISYNSFVGDEDIQLMLSPETVSLTNAGRNRLLDFVYAQRGSTQLTMKRMKEEIFTMIGYAPENPNFANTISVNELKAVYLFLKNTTQK